MLRWRVVISATVGFVEHPTPGNNISNPEDLALGVRIQAEALRKSPISQYPRTPINIPQGRNVNCAFAGRF